MSAPHMLVNLLRDAEYIAKSNNLPLTTMLITMALLQLKQRPEKRDDLAA